MLGEPREGWKLQQGLFDGYHDSGRETEIYFIGVVFRNIATNQLAWSIASYPTFGQREPYPNTYWVTEDERFVQCGYEPDEVEKHAAIETIRRWQTARGIV
jgi:hypothetical protein